jgi:hypothetical protein
MRKIYIFYKVEWLLLYDAVPSWSCSKAVYKPVWHIPLLSVQRINSWRWTEELSETYRISWQNKFVTLTHLFGFITKKFVTMHGHMNVKKNRNNYCLVVCIVAAYDIPHTGMEFRHDWWRRSPSLSTQWNLYYRVLAYVHPSALYVHYPFGMSIWLLSGSALLVHSKCIKLFNSSYECYRCQSYCVWNILLY